MALEEMPAEDLALIEDAAAKQVWNLLVQRYAAKRLSPGASPQLDLGIDSLEWLNLTLEIRRRAGVELSEQAIGRIATVRDLLREVSEAGAGVRAASLLGATDRPWASPCLGPDGSIRGSTPGIGLPTVPIFAAPGGFNVSRGAVSVRP